MTSSEENMVGDVCPSGDTVVHFAIASEVAHSTLDSNGSARLTVEQVSTFDYYSCEEAIKRLNDYLDAELDPAEKQDVLRHLGVCTPCLERFSFEKSLLVSLRDKVRQKMAPFKLKDRLSTLFKDGM